MTTSFRAKVQQWGPAEALGAHPARVALEGVLAVLAVTLAARLAVPIPGTPVPITLQDLTVLGVGLLMGPTGGYLLAYPASAWVAGAAAMAVTPFVPGIVVKTALLTGFGLLWPLSRPSTSTR